MNCSTAFDTLEAREAVADSVPMRRPAAACRSCQVLRVGGLALPVADRELLGVFLRHAGQIISHKRLAAILGLNAQALDHHVQTLREALTSAGSAYLPYTVEGLGYVLWNGDLAAWGHLGR